MPAVRLARGVLVLAAVAIAVTIVLVLRGPVPDDVSSNGYRPIGFFGGISPGQTVCEYAGKRDPATSEIEITVGTPEPPGRLMFATPGRGRGSRGKITSDPAQRSAPVEVVDGVTRLPVPAAARWVNSVCIVNVGRTRVLLAGEQADGGAVVNGRTRPFRVSIAQRVADPPRRAEVVTDVLHDVGGARGGAGGGWTGWAVVVLALGACGLAIGGSWRVLAPRTDRRGPTMAPRAGTEERER